MVPRRSDQLLHIGGGAVQHRHFLPTVPGQQGAGRPDRLPHQVFFPSSKNRTPGSPVPPGPPVCFLQASQRLPSSVFLSRRPAAAKAGRAQAARRRASSRSGPAPAYPPSGTPRGWTAKPKASPPPAVPASSNSPLTAPRRQRSTVTRTPHAAAGAAAYPAGCRPGRSGNRYRARTGRRHHPPGRGLVRAGGVHPQVHQKDGLLLAVAGQPALHRAAAAAAAPVEDHRLAVLGQHHRRGARPADQFDLDHVPGLSHTPAPTPTAAASARAGQPRPGPAPATGKPASTGPSAPS